ncbi:DUF2975 domain-containing protein [Sabulilitoribacter multivorans]|uniref:DUF2975 domain-containing protein n=1 Tax=Flaviramulus multivorans TaxID=1304750 RepID=A0ABS9IHW9_9FLAO|nr:DUF2975 domain-containing protein [Flaviramulus multivorans]MCF7559735.1 DUF2975 domain-containing protein [Flaviramulus multivorans]
MKTNQVLKTMKVLSWIIFIGLCIKSGAMLIVFLVSLVVNNVVSTDLYQGLDFIELYNFSKSHYSVFVILIILISMIKAYLFYLVVRIFFKINFNKPFSLNVANLICKISHVAFSIGVVAFVANIYNTWLISKDAVTRLHWPIQEYLFMAGIIFIIAFVFKRGIEIQSENDLTI